MKEEIKLEKRKPTFDYILNDLALSSLLIKCVHSDSASYQEKFDLQYQIKLMQKEISHLRQNKARTLEYIENNRIREKCIVDVNTLEGLLNE